MSERDRRSLDAAENDYADKFGFDPSQKQNSSIDQSREQLAGSEKADGEQKKQAVGDTKTGQAAIAAAGIAGSPVAGQAAKFLGKIRVGKGGGGAIAAVGIVAIMLFGASILTTSLGPIAFFTNIMNDLNDQLPAMDKRMQKMMRTKVMTNAERDQFIKGCTKMSVRCKFKSISSRDEARFNRAGITVDGPSVAGRKFPKTYTMEIDGKPKVFDAAGLADEVSSKNPSPAKAKVRTALNMRSFGWLGNVSSAKMRILGMSRAAGKLNGTVEEDAKLIAQGKSDIATDTTANVGVDEDGKPTVNGVTTDENGVAVAGAVSEGAKVGFRKGLTQLAKIFNIGGSADMVCSLKNMVGYSVTAQKMSKGAKLARYFAPIAARIWKIKKGDGTPHDAAVIGKIATSPDTRKTIVDIKQSLKDYDGSNRNIAEVQVPNPYYGKNMLDGSLSKMSALRAPPITTEATQKYSLGVSLASVLGTLTFATTIISAFGLTKENCNLIQNWAVRGGGFILGVLAWFTGYGEVNTAANLALAGAAMAAFIMIGIGLSVITDENPVPDDILTAPDEIHAANWTGAAFYTGEVAKGHALVPGTDAEIIEYAAERRATNLAYDKLEYADTAWYDTSSPNSLISKVATTFGTIAKPSLNGSDTIASMGALAQSAATSAFYAPAYAASIDPERLKICKPEAGVDSYAEANVNGGPIALDVQCNVRYHMPAKDLKLDVDVVVDYMENNGHVARDTESGLPEGYSIPSEDAAQNAAAAFVKGTLTGFIDQFYSTRSYGSTDAAAEYGKFLDFCVHRALPWGETFEESSGFGSAEPDWVNGKNCMRPEMKYQAFRIYTLDKAVNEASEPGSVQGGTLTTGDIAGGGTITGDVRNLAQQILDLEKAGKIVLYTLRQEDIATRTTPKLQLEDIAAGKSPAITTRCSFTVAGPINPDPRLLAFLADLGTKYKYTITSLFGQCHTRAEGPHYQGTAVDFGNCPFNTSIADAVGKKYEVRRNDESCADKSPHYHYQAGL